MIMNGEPYGYFDEMGLNSFLTYKKAWAYSDFPVCSPVNKGGRLSTTIYGTISNVLPKACLHFSQRSTNGEDCTAYLKMLKEEVAKHTDRKLHLVLDNHASHRSNLHGTKAFLQEHFIVHYMPPGSPQLNSIETYWGHYKRRFKKLLQIYPEREWTQADFENRAKQVGDKFTEEETSNLLRANHKYMLHVLDQFPDAE